MGATKSNAVKGPARFQEPTNCCTTNVFATLRSALTQLPKVQISSRESKNHTIGDAHSVESEGRQGAKGKNVLEATRSRSEGQLEDK